MSSSAIIELPLLPIAQPLLPIAPLDGASGYLRWKESVLLRLGTLDMAHVLFDERPTSETVKMADKWGRNDKLCRGHILATLSDRLLPVYAHHSTARALWRALACTYDLDMTRESLDKLNALQFVEGEPVLEHLALLQALATNAKIREERMSYVLQVRGKLPSDLANLISWSGGPRLSMDNVWKIARLFVETQHMTNEERRGEIARLYGEAQQRTDEEDLR